eukprot:UN17197
MITRQLSCMHTHQALAPYCNHLSQKLDISVCDQLKIVRLDYYRQWRI